MQIFIVGKVAEGKSTIAQEVAQHLARLGLDITLTDEVHYDSWQGEGNQINRLEDIITKDTQIEVRTIQTGKYSTSETVGSDVALALKHTRHYVQRKV
jgi:shikimate kinase